MTVCSDAGGVKVTVCAVPVYVIVTRLAAGVCVIVCGGPMQVVTTFGPGYEESWVAVP